MAAPHSAAPRPPLPGRTDCEVLVIGGGPAGAAASYWLAQAGYDVVTLERKHFPREKTCGDGLTPRAVRQLLDMGLGDALSVHHRFQGLRTLAFNKELLLSWPTHPDFPDHGYVVTRADLDALVAERAAKAGARIFEGAEALAPLRPGAGVAVAAGGAVVADRDHDREVEVHARYVVVADGSNSRVGRALGASRNRALPFGMALRGYYLSPRHAEPWIESHLDLRQSGDVVPGYGWIFPLGDGRVNVGIGLLSSAERWKQVNTTRLLEGFVASAPESWCLAPESSLGAPTGGKLPMGLSVGPRVGPDWVLAGDASGAINPFNGEGIAYGYETGRLAAAAIGAAIADGDPGLLSTYATSLEDRYGLYYKVASAFMSLMGRPEAMHRLVDTGMHSRSIMEWLLRIMSNLMRPDETGPAEAAYKVAAAIARRAR